MTAHETALRRVCDWERPWRAECTCGWKSRFYCGRNSAEEMRVLHVELAAADEEPS